MYVFKEIWQNNVANGSGMLCSVLREMCRKPTQQRKYQYWWPKKDAATIRKVRTLFMIICKMSLCCKRKSIRCEIRLEKPWTLAWPLERQLSNFACPGQFLRFVLWCSFSSWVSWSPAYRPQDNEKLLAWQEKLLVLDKLDNTFFEPMWYG